jgi:hypothetical protein
MYGDFKISRKGAQHALLSKVFLSFVFLPAIQTPILFILINHVNGQLLQDLA